MSRNILEEMAGKEIRRSKSMDVQDAVDILMGKTTTKIIAKPAKKYTREQKAERAAKIAALKAKRDGTVVDVPVKQEVGSEPEEIVKESEKELQKEDEEYLLSKFPEGTVLNADQTLTLPDGRMIRKIPEVLDAQTV